MRSLIKAKLRRRKTTPVNLPILAEEIARSVRTLDELQRAVTVCASEHGLGPEEQEALGIAAVAAFQAKP